MSKIRDFNGFRTETYSYDVLNRLIGIKEKYGEKVLEYDSRGNLIKVRKGDEILESYIYDRTNRLIRAENSDKTVASFMYDGNGRRVRKENMHGVSEYVPDYTDEYNRVLFVSRKNGNESLIYGNGLIKSENCGEFFCHFENEMTSVMRIMDNDGKTKKIMQYSPFGEVYEFGKTKDMERMPISFAGYECEENLNLMYAQARYYLPKVGRFAEEDSNKGNGYLPESLNYYVYCYNNPLFYIDLNGKSPIVLRSYFERVGGDIKAKVDKDTSVAVVTYKDKTAVFYAKNKGMDSSNSKNKAEEIAEEYSTGMLWWKETPSIYSATILSDGSITVDSKDIAKAFGIPIVTHLPGDKFNSAQTAVDMYKEYNFWAGASNTMGTAVYKTADKFTYSKAIDYKSLLNLSCVGGIKEREIKAYVLSGCNISDIKNRHKYNYLPIHYKDKNGLYQVLVNEMNFYNDTNFKTDDYFYNRNKKEIIPKIKSIDKRFDEELKHFKELYLKYKERYESISYKTGVPPELIAAIHYHEGGDRDFDWKNGIIKFSVYLHNGNPLGTKTTDAPKGILFAKDKFDEAAIDALEECSCTVKKQATENKR